MKTLRKSEISTICKTLERVWQANQHLRFWQLLAVFASRISPSCPPDCFYVGDKRTLDELNRGV